MLWRANSDRRMQHPAGEVAGRLFAAALIVGFGFSQILASWHEAGVRHVRCAEHGEVIDVVAGSNYEPDLNHGATPRATVTGAETTAPVEHQHCAVALALRGSAQVQVVRPLLRLAPPPMVVRRCIDPAPRPGRAFVLASAPKTSPPSA
jgi:hypothetical protein